MPVNWNNDHFPCQSQPHAHGLISSTPPRPQKMKASIKLREEEEKPPLLRAKFPISIFNLPFTTSISTSFSGDSSDLSLDLLTSFPSFPSLKLSFHPKDPKLKNPNPNLSFFTLTLKSGLGRFGSPSDSPLRVSLTLSRNPNPSFSLHLGHFSFASDPNPNPRVTTTMPVGRRAGLKVRWAVKLPPEVTGSRVLGRLPYLSVDKISVERVEDVGEGKGEIEGHGKGLGEKDLEGMRGMCFWMEREAEQLRRESGLIKESVEAARKKLLVEGRKNVGYSADKK